MFQTDGLQLEPVTRLLSILYVVFLIGCSEGEPIAFDIPPGFPLPRQPAENAATNAKIELGRHLFYDKRLSGNQVQSCSSCHLQALAFTDGRRVGVGSTGEAHPRNSPTLTNAAYNATYTWANPLLTDLETQILLPLFGDAPTELGAAGNGADVLARLSSDKTYKSLFAAAFPNTGHFTWDHVVQSLACFVRSLVSGDSPFDQFVYQNQTDALSAGARRGMNLFYSETLECHHCHGGFNFTESSVHRDSAFSAARFHNTGLYNIDDKGSYPPNNTGTFEVTGNPEDMGKFRAPTLRNISVTNPYMHDGSVETLVDVIRFYENGGRVIQEGDWAGDGRNNKWKSGFVAGFTLTDQERADLIEFLESLTDETFLTNPTLANPFF